MHKACGGSCRALLCGGKKQNQKKQCGPQQAGKTNHVKALQRHKGGTQPAGTMIPTPQGEASARGVPGASLHWALRIRFYSIRLVTEALSSRVEPIKEVRTSGPR